MASKKRSRNGDFLEGHGMSSMEQHGAEMRAAALPASDFEGEYPSVGTYTSPAAQRLAKVAWESRMRKAVGEPDGF